MLDEMTTRWMVLLLLALSVSQHEAAWCSMSHILWARDSVLLSIIHGFSVTV
jgi:hypothetical protein